MKKLHEIVKERFEKQKELSKITDEFNKEQKRLDSEIQELVRLESVGQNGIDLEKVQIAETVLSIQGDPYGRVDGGYTTIADLAVVDIAKGCEFMKTQFFGNKTYSSYYQRCNCEYGYGPRHGGIRDSIGLKRNYRKEELTDEQKDACIYYIKNYKAISELQKVS
jgi:hypothetical protein